MTRSIAIHGHFYQPLREDPFTGEMPREVGAEPYHDFNEKITAECYAPNIVAGNFDRISFNIGPTLSQWLAHYHAPLYERILQADRTYHHIHGAGNAIAQAAHHTILPLARRRDQITQIAWGVGFFRHCFQRQPRGIWLPEMAVDLPTLQILAEQGLSFTILSEEQVRGDLRMGAGPYRVRLPDGGYFTIFVRDCFLSNQLSFDMDNIADGRKWLEWNLRARDSLLLIATDGETFGHHHRNGVPLLANMVGPGDANYQIVALTEYLRAHPPIIEVEVEERTAWSCSHGLARWNTGCSCTYGDSSWKLHLRSALDLLADEIDAIYLYETRRLLARPWDLIYHYHDVVLDEIEVGTLLREVARAELTSEQALRVMQLAQAQVHRQQMFSSCGWFFEKLDRPEPRYVVGQALRAIQFVRQATGIDLGPVLREALCAAGCDSTLPNIGASAIRTAADLYDEWAVRVPLT